MEKKYTLISYNQDAIENHNSDILDEVLSRVQDDRNSWIIIQDCDLSDRTDIERLLSTFAANIAFTDKILNQIPLEFSDQLPDCLYLEYSTPTPVFDLQSNTYLQNRGSIVFGEGYLLLFYSTRGGFLDKLQQRVKSGQSRAQNFGIDYLLYLLFRAAINSMEELINIELVQRFEQIEDEILTHPGQKEVLKELLIGREFTKPLYEPLRRIDVFLMDTREREYTFITGEVRLLFTQNFASDLKALEEGYLRLRHWTSDLLNIHRANVGERTNHIIYILTILSAIMLPITFISSVYGMNFEYMPGVHQPFGYYGIMLIMLAIVAAMIIYMKRKGWF